ncbi:hypothetical protein FPOA_12440 [Fusarium poae]|uniref:HTH CENPB-type domain-containing protein n=2 Tax=Fusarium poae TaxID=36050 RepID=A0A1B8A939_FUSPO|nr:hypothetical protein FPOA_13644 [Fusarium poae]OBS16975.1 hypothetical protein FPOA_12440 [Fusarium poae]
MVRRNYTEDDVAEAIFDTTDRGLSQNEAAQKRGVPQWTISRRHSGQASRNERIQAHQRIPKSQEETLIRWVLRQESLGYAPSHSQLRACVEAILQQQGDNKPLGKHWTTRFVKRHPKLSTKIGKRQEAARFDGFTPKAVNWYFDIRENEYGWIKPENTVNVDEGGIMVGFGLDSLVIGSSDPKKKAMLKGVQSRTWTSFIEAVTATGRALKPGIIFKGKELQKQWFLSEFELIADWHYITSPNGWTDNHIALEWLKDVYLPQTEPHHASDARLIILDGHGSHAQDEWMATCFLNNVYCCYLPAHCSHGLQPLDNGIFNVIKGAYRKELQMLASLTDSAPVDKVNFIRAYAKAREAGMRKDIILSGWRFTGNWPINRHKALTHPEIQPDKEKLLEEFKTPSPPQLHSDDTPKTSRQVREMAKHRSRPTRRKYSKIAMGLEALEMKVAVQNARITGLEEQMAQVRRGKKRKAVPNPNQRFVALSENLAAGEALPDSKEAEIEVDVDEEVESVIEVVLDGTLYRDTGVPTARVALEDAKHRFGLRIQAVHKDHPLAARAQREMWKKRFHNRRPAGALKPPQTRLQRASMLQATFPRPRQALGKRLTAAVSVTNNRNKKEAAKEFQQWQKDLPDTHLVAFSDGSQDEKGAVGWGYAIYRDGRKIVQGKGRLGIAEVFDGEAEGARNALKRACQIDAGAQIHICIDNTSVIAGLLGDAPTSSQEAFLEFQEIAQAVAVNVR